MSVCFYVNVKLIFMHDLVYQELHFKFYYYSHCILISYEIMYYFVNTPLSDRHFIILLIIVALMYPIHKALHLLFFLPYVNSFRIHKLNKSALPYFNTYVSTPVHKIYFCINLILPFILITIFLIFLTMHFPQYGHYFMFYLR